MMLMGEEVQCKEGQSSFPIIIYDHCHVYKPLHQSCVHDFLFLITENVVFITYLYSLQSLNKVCY